mgnify:CR=1 FL=1
MIPSRRRSWIVLVVLLAAIAFAIGGQRMPDVVPATAPATEVSGARAMALLERIAVSPRPSGEPAHRQAMDMIATELEASGFTVERQRGVLGMPLTNLTVPIAGSASTGTVLLLAHYDTVVRSPGAGDDGIGVVSWLETLRALSAAGWRPRNDVLLLLTDGEECGMLGALHFARTDRRVAKVKTVVNLEAIGNGGPAFLFELGPRNGARVRLFADAVERPAGSSFAEAVYHQLPNDTDFSIFLKRGTQGFNLALTRGSCAYHAPHDTPANIDPRSVQHMADCAVALARRLGDVDLDALRAADVTFFDCLGFVLVVYPRTWDPWFAALSGALAIAALVRTRTRWLGLLNELLRHVVGVTLCAAIVVGLAWLGGLGLDLVAPWRGHVAGNTTSAALLFAGIMALAIAGTLPRANVDAAQLERRAAVAALSWSLAGGAACIWLPGTAFAVAMPGLAAGLGLLPGKRWRESWCAVLAPFAIGLTIVLPIVHLLVQLMAPEPLVAIGIAAAVGASFARLMSLPLAAVAHRPMPRRVLVVTAMVALVAALGVARGLGWRCGALWP